MSYPIIYKDKKYYQEFYIEKMPEKLYSLFHINSDIIYRFSVIVNKNSSNKYSIDIYLSSDDKDLLFNSLNNIIDTNSDEVIELEFSNKIDSHNKHFYKISQFVELANIELLAANMIMKLKIYRDKNFVIIEPRVYYSYLSITNKSVCNIDAIILSKNNIKEIEDNI